MIILEATIEILAIAALVVMILGYIERKNHVSKFLKHKLAKTQEAEEEIARKDVPCSSQVDPIIAYKKAYVLQTGELAGIGYQWRYKPCDKATCGHDRQHAVPSVSCTCGFWGLPTVEALNSLGMSRRYIALLQVEFYGEVIRLEKGFRAAQQRILSIGFPQICTACSRGAEEILSINIQNIPIHPEWSLHPCFDINPSPVSTTMQVTSAAIAESIDSDSPLMGFCNVCGSSIEKMLEDSKIPSKHLSVQHWSFADIANKFQVEAKWTAVSPQQMIVPPRDSFSPQLVLAWPNTEDLLQALTQEA